ncbi:MAG: magnesium transporter [Betaproteobacteria bacterium]
MPSGPPSKPDRQVRVVLSATALLSFTSVWKAAALALAELGAGAFFLAGVVWASAGANAPWIVLGVCAFGVLVRGVDLESWAMFVPGGLIGRAAHAFGPRGGRVAAAAILTERLVLAALAAVVTGHYMAAAAMAAAGRQPSTHLAVEEVAALAGAVIVGLLWIRARLDLDLRSDWVARGIWAGIVLLLGVTAAGVVAAHRAGAAIPAAAPAGPVGLLAAIAIALPALGSGSALTRMAHEFPPPRVHTLRRTSLLVVLFSFLITAASAFLFLMLVPPAARPQWTDIPLTGLAVHATSAGAGRAIGAVLLLLAAVLMLVPAADAALGDAEQTIRRLSSDGALPEALGAAHSRLGTPTRAIDVTAAATVAAMLAASGRVEWLAAAYGFAVAARLCLKAVSLVRLRRTRTSPRPFAVPLTVRLGSRELPLGLWTVAVVAAAAGAGALASANPPALATAGLLVVLALVFTAPGRRLEAPASAGDLDTFELLPSSEVAIGQVQARPGNILVAVRNPHALGHVGAALRAAGDRDVVVMTARLFGIDVDDDTSHGRNPTEPERQLLSQVVAIAERAGHPVHLLIVPAQNVFDAVASAAVRLESSEVYVGESASLSAADQARLLGDAWERAEKSADRDVRLVIHHDSGRNDVYHLGAHPPDLTSGDLELIHRLWLDAVKAVGPHVHHHDVVRAALMQMEQQLTGPQREEALAAIRHVARPADELAAAVHARDFSRLRDMVRNRDPENLATLLTALSLEDQVVVFRVLPRKDAAAVFEYLSHEAQETLLKAMGQEEVAALLNNMAPDDRTMFLEELPAAATRQLLSLLAPAQRAVALTLLGYPDDSVGRLMTPYYVAVREHWTVQQVLDYIREHGRDSETLNVIYVVDQQGLLIDDIRIRELLLTSPETKVSDLMDRRFAALKATDDQDTSVAAFRRYDRTALPVTDTAGMLIGIVTIDDVLDVAEATATEDIQRIGGSEALDEPYMTIAFGRMIRKRAGWLTALFLGELLTATAMATFQNEIARAVVLALFVPLVISSGGNSGSQASTLVIRALALGEVSLRDWWRVARREIFAGLALGAILGTVAFLRISIWSAFSDIYGAHWLLLAVTVAFALVGVVLWGTLIGSLLPFLLRRLGFDPATSSAPFVATLVDVTGLVIYFTVALVILRGTIL